MWSRVKSRFDKYVPTHVGNPFGLAHRMISSGNRAALFTLLTAALGMLCIPLDLILSRRENRLIESAAPTPARPIVFICGPARSGTTLVFQVLCQYLDVSYVQNVTALFPRAPITTMKLYRRLFRARSTSKEGFQNYYGKTNGMDGPSEANHLWNRWVRPDSTGFRTLISDQEACEAARFFSALSKLDDKSVVAKNNNLNVYADTISQAIPKVLIICLRRNPAFLAQSLLQARRDIKGSVTKGYGVQDTQPGAADPDPIKSVCKQINYLNKKSEQLQARIGAERFWIVDYEEFCENPGELVARVAGELGISTHQDQSNDSIGSIPVRNTVRDPKEMSRIHEELRSMNYSRRRES